MCGIYAIAGKHKAPVKRVMIGLERLEYRGYDSFGVGVRMNDGDKNIIFAEHFLGAPSLAPANDFYKNRLLPLYTKVNGGSLVVGHTRWATHGKVVEKNAHPQSDASGRVLVVLNGIIENYADLRLELEKQHGITFRSDTDTEVIPQLIGFYLKEPGMSFEDAALKTARRLTGRFAFVAMEKDSDFLLCFRGGSPLVIGRGSEEYFVSSDPSAFGDGVEEAYALEIGEYARIGKSGIQLGLFKNGKSVARDFAKLGDIAEAVTKEGYPHFMLKEIMEQENALRRAMNQEDNLFFKAAETIRSAKGEVYFMACGTAANMSAIAGKWFVSIAGMQMNFSQPSDFLPFVTKNSVLIAVSQSGETADVLEVAEKCKALGARVVAVVNTETSSLARLSDHVLPIKAGTEIGVAATKTAVCQLAVLHLLVSAVAGAVAGGRSVLSLSAHALGEMLTEEYAEMIQDIASRFFQKEHLYVLGRGIMHPVALEGALKIKEISYIHAEAFNAGELKHGPIALIEEGTPVVALVPNDETKADILNNLSEVRARGAVVIGISSVNNPLFDEWIPVTDVGAGTPIVSIVPLQMLAYSFAILRDKNPDKPRNLAKSVTVK